jgi:DNA-directed RNA polymerase specialized sigma24 family protein
VSSRNSRISVGFELRWNRELVRNHLSRWPQRRYAFENEDALEILACPGPDPQCCLESAEMLARLDRGLSCLPAEMREALMLVAVEDMSCEVAAVLLRVPVGTVRSRLSSAAASCGSGLPVM